MAALKKSINLLTAEIKPQGQWDRIYAWITNTAKYIVIITEIVVLGTIAYRFSLDGKIAELDSEIQTQKELLDARSEDESGIRQLISQLDSLQAMDNSNYSLADTYANLTQLIPSSVEVQGISVDIVNSSVTGKVTSYESLLQLENNFKTATDVVSDVNMSTAQTSGSGITFTLSFKLVLGKNATDTE